MSTQGFQNPSPCRGLHEVKRDQLRLPVRKSSEELYFSSTSRIPTFPRGITSASNDCLVKQYFRVCAQLLFSAIWLFVTPWTAPRQAPLSMGFSRPECWNGLLFPSPGDLLDPEIEPTPDGLAGGFFTTEPPGKPGCWGTIQPLISSLLVCHSIWFRTVYVFRAAKL